MDLFNNLKEKYKQLMTVNVPQTLGQIASNPGLNRFAQNLTNQQTRPSNFIKFGEGLAEGSTWGLKNVPNIAPSRNLGQKAAYTAGYGLGLVNPLNPLNKLAMGIKATKALKPAQQILGRTAGNLISRGGLTKLAGTGIANVAQGLPYGVAYGLGKTVTGQKYTGKEAIRDIGTDLALGSIPLVGGLAIGAKATGFKNMPKFEGLDKKLRAEISDLVARIKPTKFKEIVGEIDRMTPSSVRFARLGDFFEHSGLYKQYPELKNMKVQFEFGGANLSDSNKLGSFNPQTFSITIDPRQKTEGLRGTLLHEIQHSIQEIEGFAKGGNVRYAPIKITDEMRDLQNRIDKAVIEEKFKTANDLTERLWDLKESHKYPSYRKLAGEIESRAVERRANLTAAQRRQMPFYEAEMKAGGINPEDVITRFDSGTSAKIKPTQASKGVEVSSRKEIRTNLVKTPVVQKGTKVSSMQSPRELATRTKATSEVSSTPIVTEKGKLNINRLNVEGEGKKVLQAQEAQVKPTVISNKEVVKTARTANATKTMTDEQMKTLMSRQLKNRQQVVDLTKKFNQLKSEGASEQELAKVMLDLADQSRTARQGGTFAGRILQAQNIVADNSASPMQRVLALLDNAGVKEEKYLKDSIKVDWNNPKEVVGFYRKYVPPSLGEVLDEVRYTNMLSSPLTHIINLTSNALQTGVVTPVEKTLSGTIDFGKSLLTGKERKYYTTAGIDYAGGYVKALPEAFKKAWNVISGKEISVRPDFEYVPTSVGGPLKAYTLPLRMLEAGDQFFRTLVKGGVTSELGKGPKKLSVTQIADAADKESTYRLFRQAFDPNGELGQGVVLQMFDRWNSAVSNMRRLPGGKWVLPFLQTPTNILKQGVEYSPLGITTMAGAKNPVEQLSKTMIGSAVFLGAYELAKNGLVSWAAPSGDTERSLYYDAGLQPYSVKMGDKWVSFSKLGPLSYPIAMAAAMAEAERNNPDKTKVENISKSISGMLGFFGDQSYVRSIGDLVDAIEGGVNVGPTAISSEAANLLGQLIPYKSFQTWLGRIIDPTYRKANTFGEKMIKDLPIIGENLEPYTNLEGEPSMRDFPLLNALSPYKVSQEKQSVGMYDEYKTKKIQNAIEKRADEAFEKGQGLAQVGDIRRYIDDNGKVQKVDLSFPMPEYKPTGSVTLDKELLSDYKGELTKLKNSVVTAWEQGFITQDEAEAQLKRIESAKVQVGSKSTKKFTFKKVTMPKVKTTKTKKITVKRPTKSVKLLRAQKIKITAPKINVKGKV